MDIESINKFNNKLYISKNNIENKTTNKTDIYSNTTGKFTEYNKKWEKIIKSCNHC
jgi:negative regulator of genetic competence, sporulation and motility